MLENVRLPETLKKIECKAFAGCKKLKRIELPKSLECIGTLCFAESCLKKIKFPANLKVVGSGAFWGCKHLHYVEINEGLEVLG